jgi:type IV pilus assembly protein PilA
MHDTVRRLREKHRGEEGFTLIELLVVVVIIGILVAIAVPVYLNYRQGAADKSAQSDVRGAISAIEQYYTDNGNRYPANFNQTNNASANATVTLGARAGDPAPASALKVTLSDKTTLGYTVTATGTYRICAKNDGGNPTKTYLYDSSIGGSVSSPSTAITNFSNCT